MAAGAAAGAKAAKAGAVGWRERVWCGGRGWKMCMLALATSGVEMRI
ncbi:MAG: hypothetical protein GQ567_05060 [Methanosarcinales archaeon]|nr:hypothetical protein [Methanosarcinales archaeon]